VREEQKRQREENARLMDREDEKVKGKPVRSRAKANTAMTKNGGYGVHVQRKIAEEA
jgi:hypothetical protein